MMRSTFQIAAAFCVIVAISLPTFSQLNLKLQTFFQQNIGLNSDQITAIRDGEPVAKALPSRTPDEMFLFGAVYIHAAPEAYLLYARDLDRIRKVPSFLALGAFSSPPQISDLKEFSFDSEEIQDLRHCKPGHCPIQAPGSAIEVLQRSVDWSAPDVDEQVNQLVRENALEFVLGYQRDGNQAFGVYNDKRDPTVVEHQFSYMLSYSKALPEDLPDFYQYLLSYPNAKPENVRDTFYWSKVKFGLKPTLRIVHMMTMRGNPADEVAYAIAEKQLYSSHYFETALDLTFCVRSSDYDPARLGFYLIKAMGSEQAGLTGVKGSVVRKAAVDRPVSSLRNVLAAARNAVEGR
jgi:hypothetical protein